MKTVAMIFSALIFVQSVASFGHARILAEEWISEAEVKLQSAYARETNLMLTKLSCKFREGVENPGRGDVLFRAEFERMSRPIGWGWTFDANAELKGPVERAEAAGFTVAHEDYFEISGVTWVRCKVWHRP